MQTQAKSSQATHLTVHSTVKKRTGDVRWPGAAVLVLCLSAACQPSQPPQSTGVAGARKPSTLTSTSAPTATPSQQPPAAEPSAQGGVLKVCADPGNLPLSNQKGEGFQNKIAEVLATALGKRLEYYWWTYYQLGLARNTINAGKCDVLMDMSADFELGLTTLPLYRSTYVLLTRKDLHIKPTSLDDPALKQLKFGVFQSSPARQALRDHGILGEVSYLFYDSTNNPELHPARVVEGVVAGTYDAAEAWGPVAGYYVKHNGIGMQPMNTLDDEVLEYSMALAVSHKNKALRDQLNQALTDNRARIARILTDYGVPLVRCSDCLVAGELPSHGAYPQLSKASDYVPTSSPEALTQMQQRILEGAAPNDELAAAIDGIDPGRIAWLLSHGADANALNGFGDNALHAAVHARQPELVKQLLDAGAGIDIPNRDGWSPLMIAVYTGRSDVVSQLIARKAKLDTVAKDGWSALSLAITYSDAAVVSQLIEAGADVRAHNPAGFTPVIFAVSQDNPGVLDALIARGADVNRANEAGITPLMLVANRGRDELAKKLLAAGARRDARDGQGRTAAVIAQQYGHDTLASLLQQGEGGKDTR